jgi:hypothetical protein
MFKNGKILLIATAMAVGSAGLVQAEDLDVESELRELKAQVAELRAQSTDSWMTKRRAEEVKALIGDVLADADTRASMAGDGMTAGWNKNFFLASEDGNFLLKIGGRIQMRYASTHADGASGDTNESGFTARRTRVKFYGHAIDPSITYYVEPEFDKDGGAYTLKQSWIGYDLDESHTLKVGEFKSNFLHEEQVSDGRQITAERTNVNEFFTLDYSEGIQLNGEYNTFRWWTAVHDGRENENTDWDDDSTDFGANARVELMLAVEWDYFKDFQAWSGQDFGLMIGAGIDYELGEGGSGSSFNWNNMLAYTADVSTEFNGIGLYAAYVGRKVSHDDGVITAGDDSYTQEGFILQGNVFIVPDKWDLFARYEYIDFDGAGELTGKGNVSALSGLASGVEDEQEIYTFGSNYYFKKHDLKLTVDMLWAPDGIRKGESGSNTLTSNLSEEDQYALRAQMQLQF